MENKEEIRYLLERYINDTATEEEYDRLFKVLDKNSDTVEWESLLAKMAEKYPADPSYDREHWESMITKILEKGRKPAVKRFGGRLRWLAIAQAAAVAVLLGIGILLSTRHAQESVSTAVTAGGVLKSKVSPGGNKAILTLANGRTVILDSMNNGAIALQGNTKVLKLTNGQLAYNNTRKGPVKEVFNTLRTPSGGQYEVILPDGTKVWLNAVSSVRFPTAFSGSTRKVSIQGEAYFEVAKDETKPFIVSVDDIKVKVLGTHFNIKAYADEPVMKTTLLEGSVRVTTGGSAIMLRPGQQANVDSSGKMSLIRNIGSDDAVAWKKGLFQFTDSDIADIMRQIARWYNVEIEYEDGVPPGHITGKIPRNTDLSKVLEMMQLSGIHFKVEGRKVIVLQT